MGHKLYQYIPNGSLSPRKRGSINEAISPVRLEMCYFFYLAVKSRDRISRSQVKNFCIGRFTEYIVLNLDKI